MTRLVLLLALVQSPARQDTLVTERRILETEHARAADVTVLRRAAQSNEPRLQWLAARAFGRLEQPQHAPNVEPLTHATTPHVRREAINALAQMRARFDFASILRTEQHPEVRAAVYEALGRTTGASRPAEQLLAEGLRESDVFTRAGAARGVEAYFRRHARTSPPSLETLGALRTAFLRDTLAETRQLILLALTAAQARDSVVIAEALRDTRAQVRRIAVQLSRAWVNDANPMVRYQALRLAGNCERATQLLADSSEHVVLAAVDVLGERKCDAATIERHVTQGANWRVRARALVALAKVEPDRARARLAPFLSQQPWQVRAYAANAARIIGDSATLRALARDTNPNVAAAALVDVSDIRFALARSHAGLLFEAVQLLKGQAEASTLTPDLVATLQRLTSSRNVTYRDVRLAILDRLAEVADDTSMVPALRQLISDYDPAVAARAAGVLSSKLGLTIAPVTLRYEPAPLPSQAFLDRLRGARAVIQMRDLGRIELELLTEDATVTVATFAALADSGKFDGLTFHRVVPNFVLQGGSPGANEYDGLTTWFMRDELGYARNARGTLGVSTRGRDTGDGQIFINLVDNFRLDHDYTVFARVVAGMDIVDRIEEGAVIESVRIVRR